MGVEIIYTCDRCKKSSEDADMSDGMTCGTGKLSFAAQYGAKSYDGAWGGYPIKRDAFLCSVCSMEFSKALDTFLLGVTKEASQ